MSCTLQGSSSCTKNQIDMRQNKRRKSNLITYAWGTHTDFEIPKAVRQNESSVSL